VITSCPFCEFHIASHTDKPVKNIMTVLLEGYREKDRLAGKKNE
jgi:fumarate reductase (CoM/CoB) subunit B